MVNESTSGAGTAAALIEKYSALYTGSDLLSGIKPNSDGHVPGVYWELEGAFFFQPNGSSQVFEVSDVDIRRTSAST